MNYILEKKRYIEDLRKLETLYALAEKLSNKVFDEVKITKKRELADSTFLFGKITLHLRALLNVLPESKFSKKDKLKIWDISSLGVLSRALIESYIVFYYLCIEAIPDEERILRFKVWDYNGKKRQADSLKSLGYAKWKELKTKYKKDWQEIKDAVFENLKNHKYNEKELKNLKKRIKEGNNFLLVREEDILKKAGIPKNYYKLAYTLMCQYVHSTSLAVNVMRFPPRNPRVISIFDTFLHCNKVFTTFSIRDFVNLYPKLLKNMINNEFDILKKEIISSLEGFA